MVIVSSFSWASPSAKFVRTQIRETERCIMAHNFQVENLMSRTHVEGDNLLWLNRRLPRKRTVDKNPIGMTLCDIMGDQSYGELKWCTKNWEMAAWSVKQNASESKKPLNWPNMNMIKIFVTPLMSMSIMNLYSTELWSISTTISVFNNSQIISF